MNKYGHMLLAAALNSGAEREEYAKIPPRQLEHALCKQPIMPSSPSKKEGINCTGKKRRYLA